MTIQDVKKETARFFRMRPLYLDLESRKRNIVIPRQIAHYIALELELGTLEEIASMIGHKNHATVVNSHRTIQDLADTGYIYEGWKMSDIITFIKRRLVNTGIPKGRYTIFNYPPGQIVKKNLL